jgi:hypothetical protein
MNPTRFATVLKWLARIILTLTVLWLLFFGYLDFALGDFFGPPNWTAILLVAFVGFLIGSSLSFLAKRISVAD